MEIIMTLILLNGLCVYIWAYQYNKQHCLQQAKLDYEREEFAEQLYDERHYRDQLEDIRKN